jgi:hypothetical protein
MTVKFIELQDRKIVTQMFEENPVWYMTCFSHFLVGHLFEPMFISPF